MILLERREKDMVQQAAIDQRPTSDMEASLEDMILELKKLNDRRHAVRDAINSIIDKLEQCENIMSMNLDFRAKAA